MLFYIIYIIYNLQTIEYAELTSGSWKSNIDFSLQAKKHWIYKNVNGIWRDWDNGGQSESYLVSNYRYSGTEDFS